MLIEFEIVCDVIRTGINIIVAITDEMEVQN